MDENGTRHAVSIDVDSVTVVLATDRAAIRGSTHAPLDGACMSAIEATYGGTSTSEDYSALIFPDDLAHSVLFTVTKDDAWPQAVSVRPMECAYTTGALPEELRDKPGFSTGGPPTTAQSARPASVLRRRP